MEIDETTGLPEVAEGQYWKVEVLTNQQNPGDTTLAVTLYETKEVVKTRIIEKEEPGWFWRTKTVRVEEEYTGTTSEFVDRESLREYEIVTEAGLKNLKPGWNYVKQHTYESINTGNYMYSSYKVTKPDLYYTWYDHPETPESIRAAAVKIVERVRKRETKQETRDSLIGVYPPKKLEGSE